MTKVFHIFFACNHKPAANTSQFPIVLAVESFAYVGCRPDPVEEVYRFRQVTQFAAFTPETLTHINAALKTFSIWQVSVP